MGINGERGFENNLESYEEAYTEGTTINVGLAGLETISDIISRVFPMPISSALSELFHSEY